MSGQPSAAWAEPAIADALVKLAGKMSTAAIAAELSAPFSTPITRNAVIGRINRTGLPRQPRSGAGVPRPTTRRGATKPPAQGPRLPRLKPDPPPVRREDTTRASGKACPIENVRGCRWPIADPPRGTPHLFCNAAREEGQPYCLVHQAILRPVGRSAS